MIKGDVILPIFPSIVFSRGLRWLVAGYILAIRSVGTKLNNVINIGARLRDESLIYKNPNLSTHARYSFVMFRRSKWHFFLTV